MRTAVVGHVEWGHFLRVERMPDAGDIVHATRRFEVVAGGGPVAAVQLRKLSDETTFYTALGRDELGERSLRELTAMGVRVAAAWRDEPQREAVVHVDGDGERTITVLGSRLGPEGGDDLPWDELASMDAVYFCAGDDDALRLARSARVLVATSREAERVARVAQPMDAVVGSAADPAERYVPTDPSPGVVVATQGPKGGRFRTADGTRGRFRAPPLDGPVVCAYGAGDSFAAGLTFALGDGRDLREALRFAARCGAACLRGEGPYAGQLSA